MRYIKKSLILLLGLFICNMAQAQYANPEPIEPLYISSEVINSSFHPGVPDTLISLLDFQIEVFISIDNKPREGASKKKDGLGKFVSKLDSSNYMVLDTTRLRSNNKKPVTLIVFIPSDQSGNIRGITTSFNEHFDPTSTNFILLEDKKGIEIRYNFREGIPRLPRDHEHQNFEGTKGHIGTLQHIVGHICDPSKQFCP